MHQYRNKETIPSRCYVAYQSSLSDGSIFELLQCGRSKPRYLTHCEFLRKLIVTDPLSEVYFINDSVGWIVGGQIGNVILHTTNGGRGGGSSTGIDAFKDEDGTTYSLEQNYPNPFSSSTKINYRLGDAGHISLTVYDISGRKIQNLVNEFRTAGKHSINWDASQYSNGLYFYELNVDQGPVNVKKMMLER